MLRLLTRPDTASVITRNPQDDICMLPSNSSRSMATRCCVKVIRAVPRFADTGTSLSDSGCGAHSYADNGKASGSCGRFWRSAVLMQPWNTFAGPHPGRVSAPQFLSDPAQPRVIIRSLIVCDSSPVHRLRRKMGVPIASDHVAIPSFRIGVFLLHEGDTAKTIP